MRGLNERIIKLERLIKQVKLEAELRFPPERRFPPGYYLPENRKRFEELDAKQVRDIGRNIKRGTLTDQECVELQALWALGFNYSDSIRPEEH